MSCLAVIAAILASVMVHCGAACQNRFVLPLALPYPRCREMRC